MQLVHMFMNLCACNFACLLHDISTVVLWLLYGHVILCGNCRPGLVEEHSDIVKVRELSRKT